MHLRFAFALLSLGGAMGGFAAPRDAAAPRGAPVVTDAATLARSWARFPSAPPAAFDPQYAARCDEILLAQGCVEVELRQHQGQFFTLARIGRAEIIMGIDTGAHMIALEAAWRNQLGVPLREQRGDERPADFAGTRVERSWSAEATLVLGGYDLGLQTLLIRESPLPPGYWRPGLLGVDVLRRYGAWIDCARGKLLLQPRGGAGHGAYLDADWWSGGYTMVRMGRGPALKPVLTVVINGVRGWMILDTGDPRTTLSLGAARRAGVNSVRVAAGTKTDYYGKQHPVYEGTLPAFQVGAVPMPPHRVRMVDYLDAIGRGQPADWGVFFGLLGNEALIASGAVIDCGRDRIYFANRVKMQNFGRSGNEERVGKQ